MKTNASHTNVDEHGFDAAGRIVASFGSPVVDGSVDAIWSKAQPFTAKHVSSDVSASFRVLWDDEAVYILAEVKDNNLSVESFAPYMQDSVEIFLDEHNDKATAYGGDHVHVRINYNNLVTVDKGDPERFYTAAKVGDDGYVITARIALKTEPENGKVIGIELQVNDAVGTERVGGLNVFDGTGQAWLNPSTFGEAILIGKEHDSVSGLNPYHLLSDIKAATRLDFKHYKNENIVVDAIANIVHHSLLNDNGVTQAQLDEQHAALLEAVNALEMTDEAKNEKYFEPLPNNYRTPCKQSGSIERLYYETANVNGGMDEKKLHVYMPHGYNSDDKDKRYNVLYLMHGGGENEDLLLGGPDQNTELKLILDHMIANQLIDPLIVVTPTFYGGQNDVSLFYMELIDSIVPMIELKYNTFTKSDRLDDLKASRAHRAFGGFSMGSVTTWYTFVNALDYFKYFIPLSGDSWVIEQRGGGLQPRQTAEYLANAARQSGYSPQDYYIFSATGALDIAYPNLKPQVDAMKQHSDAFIYSADLDKGNFYFLSNDVGTHTWYWQNQFLYNILPDLFKT